jgi:hypothetical protein
MSSAIALVLIALGTVSRLSPHPSNLVFLGPTALALYAGARLPRAWAIAVPLLALFVSDLVLDWGTPYTGSFFTAEYLTRYATFAVVAWAGWRLRGRQGVPARMLMAVGASTLFFLTTNFAVWAAPYGVGAAGPMYPRTSAGLWTCYVAALPFYRNSFAADVIGTGLLFGLDALAHRLGALWALRRRRALAVEPVSVEAD